MSNCNGQAAVADASLASRRLREGVHLWTSKLDVAPAQLARLEPMLSPDEHARAMKYRSTRDGGRFLVRRAMLRAGLGGLLGVAPHRIGFRYGPAGKPYLWEPSGARVLRFSLAHSDGLAVFGCTLGRALGIDLERAEEHADLSDVATACFSPREQATLAALPRPAQTAAFYRCWTRKEAYVKAIGSGLGAPLDDFDVACGVDEPPALLRVGWQPSERTRWRMEALSLRPGYIGALVVGRRSSELAQLNSRGVWS